MTPRLADRHDVRDYLAAGAAHLLHQREASYPALIERATLTEADATRKLALARIVAAQWRWIVDPARPPLPAWNDDTAHFGAFDHDLAAELDAAAARARSIATRNPPTGTTPFHALTDHQLANTPADELRRLEAVELADLYEALAWWQQPERTACRIVNHVAFQRRPIAAPPADRLAA